MIFCDKQELQALVDSADPKIGLPRESSDPHERTLEFVVDKIWADFNGFFAKNKEILNTCFIEMHKYLLSLQDANGSNGMVLKAKRGNGMIYHEFSLQRHNNDLFAEDEIMASRIFLVPAANTDYALNDPDNDPEAAQKSSPLSPVLTPAQMEIEKMKQIVRTVNGPGTQPLADFKLQFVDLLKNVNQSYSMLKNTLVEGKKAGPDTASAITEDQTQQSSLQLFRKIKHRRDVKTNHGSQAQSGITVKVPKNAKTSHILSQARTDARSVAFAGDSKFERIDTIQEKKSRLGHRMAGRDRSLKSEESSGRGKVQMAHIGPADHAARKVDQPRPPPVTGGSQLDRESRNVRQQIPRSRQSGCESAKETSSRRIQTAQRVVRSAQTARR